MTARRRTSWTREHAKELSCFAVFLALLAGWLVLVLAVTPRAVDEASGATWGHYVHRLYGQMARELDRVVRARAPGGWDALDRIVVLPVAGDALARYQFASPRAEGLAEFLRQAPELQAQRDRRGAEFVRTGPACSAGELGLRIFINAFQEKSESNPRHFSARMEAKAYMGDDTPVELVPAERLEDSNATLSWFLAVRRPFSVRALWLGASSVLMVLGLLFGLIYYRLVAGTFIGPSWLAIPLNELRAATGLIASSLLFLTGFVSLLLLFFLVPIPGDALNPWRLHVDVILETSEAVYPSTELGLPDHNLHRASRNVAAAVMTELIPKPEAAEAAAADLPPTVDASPFQPWFHRGLPDTLRTRVTEIRISRGSTWRVFGASDGQAIPVVENLQATGAWQPGRTDLLDRAFTLTHERQAIRNTGLPIPWDVEAIPPLEPGTLASLRLREGGAEGNRYARLIIGTFHTPSLDTLNQWVQRGAQRPADSRIYAVVLPALPRSLNRFWDAIESQLLAARFVADRVASLYPVPSDLGQPDYRLQMYGERAAIAMRPDVEAPVFAFAGVDLKRLANFANPVNLEAERALRFGWMNDLSGQARHIARDFKQWLLGADRESERILVFTMPRQAYYWLTIGLGIVFVLAGVRSEQNAQGLPRWAPFLVAALTVLVLPVLASLWIYSRGDTTRYVIFGYADLGFWGAGFLWFCLAVVPLFLGRLRVGLRRDVWMTLVMLASLMFLAAVPFLDGELRTRVAQGCLIGVGVLAVWTVAWCVISRVWSHSLGATVMLLVLAAVGYVRWWGWAEQDMPAMFLFASFLVMIVSGWRRGVLWWQVLPRAQYDRIAWLFPANRLLLALLLTLAGAAILYCSFPLVQSGGWIRGYDSYCLFVCLLPFLLSALALIMLDTLQKDIH